MEAEAWRATGVIEAPLERVLDVLLAVSEGPIGAHNAPLLCAVPGAGWLLTRATLQGGPHKFTIHYGQRHGQRAGHYDQHPGGTVEVDRDRGSFGFRGGYKFGAEYHFTPHPKGTLLTYRTFNIAPERHRNRAIVRVQFRLGGTLKIGLRGGLRRIGKLLGCRAYPGA
ncbi:hypothetical protein [Actinophytocola sp.]|uniref:hypothetical protein n=1 Tax=Actinophytocola sp. TaxID=1872138 RepID=UPI00389985C1